MHQRRWRISSRIRLIFAKFIANSTWISAMVGEPTWPYTLNLLEVSDLRRGCSAIGWSTTLILYIYIGWIPASSYDSPEPLKLISEFTKFWRVESESRVERYELMCSKLSCSLSDFRFSLWLIPFSVLAFCAFWDIKQDNKATHAKLKRPKFVNFKRGFQKWLYEQDG